MFFITSVIWIDTSPFVKNNFFKLSISVCDSFPINTLEGEIAFLISWSILITLVFESLEFIEEVLLSYWLTEYVLLSFIL